MLSDWVITLSCLKGAESLLLLLWFRIYSLVLQQSQSVYQFFFGHLWEDNKGTRTKNLKEKNCRRQHYVHKSFINNMYASIKKIDKTNKPLSGQMSDRSIEVVSFLPKTLALAKGGNSSDWLQTFLCSCHRFWWSFRKSLYRFHTVIYRKRERRCEWRHGEESIILCLKMCEASPNRSYQTC